MFAPSVDLLRAGMALKLSHLKRAAQSYLLDRASQTTGLVTSYAVAASLFVVAGLCLIATLFVGLVALYRWVAIHYGQFLGLGAVAAVFLVFTAVCVGAAMAKINRRTKPIVPLTSRMRVAMAAPRIPRGTAAQALKDVVTTLPTTLISPGGPASPRRPGRSVQIGLALMAVGLLGFTAARRRHYVGSHADMKSQ